jgi:phosphoserine/homoserine phosphotransferase
MNIVCADLEGVFVPEIWINVAEKTGIEELRLTTRDISDYDVLMKKRLSILDRNNLKLKDITDVIATMAPLEGAVEFLDWLRLRTQIVVVSDTYEEFARPLMKKLGYPTLFCHSLTINGTGAIADYNLRQREAKKNAVLALKGIQYRVIAMGDSYNDMNMLEASDQGILFRPPENVVQEYPNYPVVHEYHDLMSLLEKVLR